MSNPDEICTSGVWVDTKNGDVVVTSRPEEGTQLVPPGAVVYPEHHRAVELAGASLADLMSVAPADVPDVETATPDVEDVETATADAVAPKTRRSRA